jgi:hypothetical protein
VPLIIQWPAEMSKFPAEINRAMEVRSGAAPGALRSDERSARTGEPGAWKCRRGDDAPNGTEEAAGSRWGKRSTQAPASEAAKKALGSLGYLAGSQSSSAGEGVPKDRIAEYQLFQKALDAFYAGRVDEAITNLRRVRAQYPTNKPAADALAEYEKVRRAKQVETTRERLAAARRRASELPASASVR